MKPSRLSRFLDRHTSAIESAYSESTEAGQRAVMAALRESRALGYLTRRKLSKVAATVAMPEESTK